MELTPMFILGLLNFLLIIIVGCFNIFSHFKIVGNDLHHLNLDVKALLSKQEVISNRVNSLAEDLAFVKGKCELHTSKILKKSKKAKVGNAN